MHIYIKIFIHYRTLDYTKHLLIKQSLLRSTKTENEITIILIIIMRQNRRQNLNLNPRVE